jgi:hypothetical protein
VARGATMLTPAIESYLATRQAVGFRLKEVAQHLRSFAAYSVAQGQCYLKAQTAIDWAGQAGSVHQRARRRHSLRPVRAGGG